jgi:glycosidase
VTRTATGTAPGPGDTEARPRTLATRTAGIEITLDPHTGLPSAFAATQQGASIPIRVGIELETDGDEIIPTTGGLSYANTRRHPATEAVPDSLRHTTNGPNDHYILETSAGEWLVRTTLTLRPEHPRVALRIAASPRHSQAGEGILRALYVNADLAGDLDDWLVEAPGNTLRPGMPADAICEPVVIATAGYELGSPGIVALHHPAEPTTFAIWPMSRSEQGPITLDRTDTGLRLRYDTQLAGAVPAGEWIEHGPIHLDVLPKSWGDVRDTVHSWYPSMGVQTPTDRPDWAAAASLYEVMIGSAPFRGGHEYAPYPSLQNLIDDLDRIADLGFTCLQLMPRHPYPSYNIHQPGDVATTYGPPTELRRLVDECHRRGLRIVLDILLHGVVDKQIVEKTARLVRQGPHADNLDDPCLDVYGEERVEISWCRHILEFEPHWHAGAVDRHPLLKAQPEWFMRDSSGAIIGRYTHALDIANPDWQECFIGSCESLVRDYAIDGFRFDAPFYNLFANWSPSTRRHASYSNLGYLDLFRRLRQRLHEISPELMLYTEPSGPLARESLDLNYSYPESWLIASLFDGRLDGAHDWRRVRNGRQLADWFHDFDAALPPGSATAHFVDCHDTIWWRLPGDLWRREQIGLPATKALVAIYGLRGGGYLSCAGAELGVEDELRRMLDLRATHPEIGSGVADYASVSCVNDEIYAVLRRDNERATLVAVNTAEHPVSTEITIDGAPVSSMTAPDVVDLWNDERLRTSRNEDTTDRATGATVALNLSFDPYQVRVIPIGGPPRPRRD